MFRKPGRGSSGRGLGRGQGGRAWGQDVKIAPVPQELERPFDTALVRRMQSVSLLDRAAATIELPMRPSFGTRGMEVELLVNLFRTMILPSMEISQYDVTFMEKDGRVIERLGRQKAIEIVRAVGTAMETKLDRKITIAFDGQKIAYMASQNIGGGHEVALEEHKVRFQLVGKRKLEEIFKLIKDKDRSALYLECIAALNTMLKEEETRKSLTEIGRSRFFDLRCSQPVFNGIFRACKGFSLSLRPCQWGLMLNVDPVITAFMPAQPLVDFICANMRLKALPRRFTIEQIYYISKITKGIRFTLTHRKGGKPLIVSGLSHKPADKEQFSLSDDSVTTVAAYFKEKYQTTLRHPGLPCVQVGSRTYFPLEVCRIEEGQCVPHMLREEVATELICTTAVSPQRRFNNLYTKVKELVADSGLAETFGLRLTDEAIKVPALKLADPGIKTKNGTMQASGGVWSMQRQKFYRAARLAHWVVVSFCSRRCLGDQGISKFVQSQIDAMRMMGMEVLPPAAIYFAEDFGVLSPGDVLTEIVGRSEQRYDLVLCLKELEKVMYDEIKCVAETRLDIMTQCVTLPVITKANLQVHVNLAYKMNEKLGGINSIVEARVMDYIRSNRVMIMGADVTHPAPRSDRPSIAAVIGSIDMDARKHVARVAAQSSRQEVISDMRDMTLKLIETYRRQCGSLPHQILFYRDGVSEGHFQSVLQVEAAAIKEACRRLRCNPALVFIVVQKRHSIRLFCPDPRFQDRSGNPLAGMCVDRAICHPTDRNFYLLSHTGIQGTSKPSHYYVLRDEVGIEADVLHELTYYLCHNYSRCTRSVSIVPAVYYAHHAAKRAKAYLVDGMLMPVCEGVGSQMFFS